MFNETLKDKIIVLETLLEQAGVKKVERHCLMEDYDYVESLLRECKEVISTEVLLELGLLFY